MALEVVAAVIWFLGLAGFAAIRAPRRKRAAQTHVRESRADLLEYALLGFCILSLALVPVIHLATEYLSFADYRLQVWQVPLGALAIGAFLWLFRTCHKQIGRNWSVTLELRENHRLVTDGLYAHMRHPMYTSFFLWALGQALLLPNWLVAVTGLLSIALLYGLRVSREERMMRDAFGAEYEAYCKMTPRLVPRIGG